MEKRPDTVVHQEEPLNLETAPEALMAEAVTPIDAFYVRTHGPLPAPAPGEWTLRVDGMVDTELAVELDALRRSFTGYEVTATLSCAGNRRADLVAVAEIPGEIEWGAGAAGTARFRGVRLADVLDRAGVGNDVGHIALLGADRATEADPVQPFGGSIPIAKARSGEVLLAWAMNGAPLTHEHGGPLRLVVPGYVAARSVKWLTRVTAQAGPSANYFQARSYRVFPPDADPDRAPAELGRTLTDLEVNSAILSPRGGATVDPGPLTVTGYALTGGGRTVERVEVSVDGGRTWAPARMLDDLGPWAWRRWRVEVEVESGTRELAARAEDSAGARQPEHADSVWNPSGYANNAWPRVRVEVR